MSDATTKMPAEFDGLSPEERIRRVQELWDFIAQSPEDIPIPESHKRILDARLDEFDQDPEKPWEEVRDSLLRELRSD